MRNLVLILSLGFMLAACDQKAPHPKTLLLNRQGNKELKEQRFDGAFNKYVEALRFDPFQSELHLDLGLTFEIQQQAEKAVASYKEAERLAMKDGNFEVAFMSRFNLGQLFGKAKKYDEALAAYQSALEILPTSNEVKTNIELLIQQQQQGGKDGDNKDQQQQDGQDQKDKKDKDGKDPKDQKDKDKQDENKDQDQKDKGNKEKEDKDYQPQSKYKPRPFNGKELSEADVKKILGELKQQEQKIRAEFNRKDTKEQPRDKDW